MSIQSNIGGIANQALGAVATMKVAKQAQLKANLIQKQKESIQHMQEAREARAEQMSKLKMKEQRLKNRLLRQKVQANKQSNISIGGQQVDANSPLYKILKGVADGK